MPFDPTSPINQDEINAMLWKACDTFRGTVDPSEYKNYILVMLFLKYLSDIWRDKVETLQEQFADNPERLQRRLKNEPFILPENTDYYALYDQRQADNIGEHIYDPACGSGSLLIKCANQVGSNDYALYGQESNGSTWALAMMNMFLHQMQSPHIAWADTLNNPQHTEGGQLKRFNVVHDHAILQAIARVNRVHPGKEFGFVVDYRGVLGELNEAIETYDELAEFDTEDIAGTIQDVKAIIALLPQHHSDLWAIFQGVNTADMEALALFLEPDDVRQRFYEALTTFTGTLKVALGSTAFYKETSPSLIAKYKNDLKKFIQLRQDVKVRFAEAVDFRDYEKKIRKLLDAHIDAGEVRQLTAEVSIFDQPAFDEAVATLGSPRAKAEAILNHLKRTVLEDMERDPAYYRKFSKMIEDTLHDIAEGRLQELDALKKADELRQEFLGGQRKDLPGELGKYRDAPAYYGIMEEVVNERLVKEERAKFAIRMEEIIQQCKITDWQHNPDVQKQMINKLEDALYDLEKVQNIEFTNPELDEITYGVLDVAKRRD